MIYFKPNDILAIDNQSGVNVKIHVSYADVNGATLSGGTIHAESTAATYNVFTFGGPGLRNVRVITVENAGVTAEPIGIIHGNGTLSPTIHKAVIQPGQILSYTESNGFTTSSPESSTLSTLTLPATQSPGLPASNYGTIFMKKIGGRMMASQMGPSGLDTSFQPNLGGNKVALWMPPGNTTVPGVFGMLALTNTGTATARTVSTANVLSRMTRYGIVSVATVGGLCGAREAFGKYTTGAGGGLGGFYARYRFGISDAATVAGARMFVGLDLLTAAPTNIDPSTKVNCIGVGQIAASNNLQIIRGNATAKTPIDLGSNFPANTNSDAYELTLFAPTDGGCHYQVTRLNTAFVATGFLPSTELPLSTTLLCHQLWRTNNATALAVGLDICGVYIETDY